MQTSQIAPRSESSQGRVDQRWSTAVGVPNIFSRKQEGSHFAFDTRPESHLIDLYNCPRIRPISTAEHSACNMRLFLKKHGKRPLSQNNRENILAGSSIQDLFRLCHLRPPFIHPCSPRHGPSWVAEESFNRYVRGPMRQRNTRWANDPANGDANTPRDFFFQFFNWFCMFGTVDKNVCILLGVGPCLSPKMIDGESLQFFVRGPPCVLGHAAHSFQASGCVIS